MESADPNEELFFAIAFIDHPGATDDFKAQMENAIANGADLEGISESGQTPLTAAIEGGMGSPTAVEILLKHGADPGKRDDTGWTPWGICVSRIEDRVVADEMAVIKGLLEKYNADRSDEIYLEFQKAILNGNTGAVKSYLDEGIDPNNPIAGALGCAIYAQDVETARLILNAGADVNHADEDGETPLISAAAKGYQEIVGLLLEHGADTTRVAWDDERCTAEFMARQNGHAALADWLLENMPDQPNKSGKTKNIPAKYRALYESNTDGINCGLTTDDIVKKLQDWDRKYVISISDVEPSGFVVSFEDLPGRLAALAKDIYAFCPDCIEQGYGCMDDMVRMAEESGRELDAATLDLIDGIDFSDDKFGLRILARDLENQKKIRLWWD